jgi:hypothetical protein
MMKIVILAKKHFFLLLIFLYSVGLSAQLNVSILPIDTTYCIGVYTAQKVTINNCQILSPSNVLIFYEEDINHLNNGIQNCSQPFNKNFIEDGIVSKSYNDGDISITDLNITGSDKIVGIYSTGSITISSNVTIGEGATFSIGYSACPAE